MTQRADWNRAHRLKHPDRYRRLERAHNTRRRLAFMGIFGGFCSFCGETDPAVLQVDHIIPIGRTGPRRSSGQSHTYVELCAGRESPFNLQVVCANCHARKTRTELGWKNL